MKSWFFQKASRVRQVLNLWPPFLFSGIRITELSDDYRHCRVELKNWPGTRNANGSQFGGSLFAMTDPVYSLMLMGLLGSRYYIWDKSAHIDFIRPGHSMRCCDKSAAPPRAATNTCPKSNRCSPMKKAKPWPWSRAHSISASSLLSGRLKAVPRNKLSSTTKWQKAV